MKFDSGDTTGFGIGGTFNDDDDVYLMMMMMFT
jgi:hypothetical protein